MNDQFHPDDVSLSRTVVKQIDQVCDRFENALKADLEPRIEDHLEEFEEPARSTLLYQLLLLELDYRSRAGDMPTPEEYRSRFPGYVEIVDSVFRETSAPEVAFNLLFGALALKKRHVGRQQLITAVREWSEEKTNSLSQILLDQGALDGPARALVEALVEEHLQKHDNDPIECLARAGSIDTLCEDLRQANDNQISAVLDRLSDALDVDPIDATASWAESSGLEGGRFRKVRFHARGGAGEVWIAMDEELHREVAFKGLREKYAHDTEFQSRFMAEAEITGTLEHPGIVPVYGVGRDGNGRPFYVMRFVRGESLKKTISQFHRADAAGWRPEKRAIQFRKLLDHFIDVCNAIHFAHSRGVIHRDLKPSNVMLGTFGETFVVDWGLAKPIGRMGEHVDGDDTTLHPVSVGGSTPTQMGSVVGTPAYMSPEQAGGQPHQLGPATDVYSLGATLYHLLTGREPFESEDRNAVLEKVREGDFPPPGQIGRRVPPQMEAICLKAMALKPPDRYASPGALARDIEHWLADEPVSARRETVSQRLGRWMRRHRIWTQAGIGALLLVAAVSVVATFIVNRSRQAATTAAENEQAARRDAESHEQEAIQRLIKARDVVDTWLTGASEVLEYYPGMLRIREQLLEKAAEDYEWFAEQNSDDIEQETERGRAYLRLGDIRRSLREFAAAQDAYRSAASLFAQLSDSDPGSLDCRLELANSHTRLGMLLGDLGKYEDAEEAYATAAAELHALAELQPKDPRSRDALATSLLNRGALLTVAGSRQEAEKILRQAVSEFESLLQAGSGESRYLAGMSKARNVLGQILVDQGHHDEAQGQLTKAISSFDILVEKEPHNREHLNSLVSARLRLASVLKAKGRYAEELDAYRGAVTDCRLLISAFPGVPAYTENLAVTRTDLGQLMHQLGDTAEAETELNEALFVFENLVTNHPQVPQFHQEQGACCDILGQVLSDRGHHEKARLVCKQAEHIFQELAHVFPDVPQYRERLAVNRSHLAQVLHKLEDHEAAGQMFQMAIDSLEELIRSDPAAHSYQNEIAFVYCHSGNLLSDMEDTHQAEEAFRQARQRWQDLAALPATPEYLNECARFLVHCADPQFRDPKQAIELARRARDDAPENATYCNTLGVAHYRAGNWDESIEMLREAMRLRQEGNSRDWFFLAMGQHQLGEKNEAQDSYRQGCDWMDENRPGNLELRRIRNEASELLGGSEPAPPPPRADGSSSVAARVSDQLMSAQVPGLNVSITMILGNMTANQLEQTVAVV